MISLSELPSTGMIKYLKEQLLAMTLKEQLLAMTLHFLRALFMSCVVSSSYSGQLNASCMSVSQRTIRDCDTSSSLLIVCMLVVLVCPGTEWLRIS